MGSRGPKPESPIPLESTPDLSYFLGLLKGDGCIQTRVWPGKLLSRTSYRIRFGSKSQTLATSFMRVAKRLGFRASIKTRFAKCRGRIHGIHYCVSLRGPGRIRWLKSLDIKDIEKIVTLTPKHSLTFLRGFYEAEGNVHTNGRSLRCCIRMGGVNKELIEMVFRIIKNAGYNPNFRIRTKHSRTTFTTKPFYTVHLTRHKEAISFLRRIRPLIKGIPEYERKKERKKLLMPRP